MNLSTGLHGKVTLPEVLDKKLMKNVILFIGLFLISFSLIAQKSPYLSIHQEQSEFYSDYKDFSEKDFDTLLGIGNFPFESIARQCILEKKVFGYHPYWIGSAYLNYQWDLLSDLCYFSYEVDPLTGDPITIHNFMTAPVVDSALANEVNIHLCVTLFSGHSTFFSSTVSQQTLINNLISMISVRSAKGVNIDFEAVPYTLGEELTAFMIDLSVQMHDAIPGSIVSMATPAVDWNEIIDIEILNEYIDLFMIMGYDYYWNGSSQAGPVDGLYSLTSIYNYNLSRTLSYYLSKGASPDKILLGLPYYGRQWPTQSSQTPSNVTGWGQAKTYANIHNSTSGNYIEENKHFESNSFSPYYAFVTSGWNQCFIDDIYSLGKRYDIVNQKKIAGIGIWALGYDHGYTELWELIQNKFTDCAPPVFSDTIYDSGGPSFNYYNDEDYFFVLSTEIARNLFLRFLSFELEPGYDILKIFDGPNPESPLIGEYSGYILPDPIMSSGNTLTFHFQSDNNMTMKGWEAVWEALTVSVPETGLEEAVTWSVYPNPFSERVTVEVSGLRKIREFENLKIEALISDIRGQIYDLRSYSITPNDNLQFEVDFSTLDHTGAGLYFIELFVDDLLIGTEKLIFLPE